MTSYYLAPTTWRQDEYRDVVTESNIRDQFDNWKSIGSPYWETWEDARDDCDPLDADTLRDLAKERCCLGREPQFQNFPLREPSQFAQMGVALEPEHRGKPHGLAKNLCLVTVFLG